MDHTRDRPHLIGAYVDRRLAQRMNALAKLNERAVSAELRVALRRHLECAEKQRA